MNEAPRPECEKLCSVAPLSQKIGEFIDWMQETYGASFSIPHEHTENCEDNEGFMMCGYRRDELQSFYYPTEKLLAEFFGIDMAKVEDERRNLLKELQEHHKERTCPEK